MLGFCARLGTMRETHPRKKKLTSFYRKVRPPVDKNLDVNFPGHTQMRTQHL